MKKEIADQAMEALIAAMQADATTLATQIELAASDLKDGSRNGAMGALSTTDEMIERMAATLSAARAIHRAAF